MTCAGVVIAIGLFLVDIVLVLMILGVWDPIYKIEGDKVGTKMTYSIWGPSFSYKDHHRKMTFNEEPLLSVKDSQGFRDRTTCTLVFVFTGIGISGLIVILGFLDCCRIIQLEKGVAYCSLLVLAVLLLIFTVATPAIPTGDYYSEKNEFNHVNSRNQSFYYNCLFAVANSTDQHLFAENRKQMLKDLQNETLQMDIGWVLIVLWCAPPFAFLALLLFACSKCCAKSYDNRDERARLLQEEASKRISPGN